MSSAELYSCCFCYVLRQQFAYFSANVPQLFIFLPKQHKLVHRLPCTILNSYFCSILTLHIANVCQSWSTLVMQNKLWELSQSKTAKILWINDHHNYTKNGTRFENWAIQRQQPMPRRLHKKINTLSNINLPSMEFVIIIVRIGLPSILQLAPRKPTRDLILSARNSLSSAR